MKQTQIIRIKQHLLTYGKITPLAALNMYGVYRLSAIIHVLRKEGMEINTLTKTSINRFGDTVRYADYRLLTPTTNNDAGNGSI